MDLKSININNIPEGYFYKFIHEGNVIVCYDKMCVIINPNHKS